MFVNRALECDAVNKAGFGFSEHSFADEREWCGGVIDVLLLELLDAKEKDKLCGGLTNAGGVEQFEMIFGANSYDALSPFRPDSVCERCGGRELRFELGWRALPRKRLDD